MNEREIIVAALRWHTAQKRRLEIGAEKRRLEKAMKDGGMEAYWRLVSMQNDAASRLTPARRRELAALRQLAKACEEHRGHLERVEDADSVIDAKILPWDL